MGQDVVEAARRFIEVLNADEGARAILSERDHFLDFETRDDSRFHLSVKKGEAQIVVGPTPSTEDDLTWVTHFSAPADTLIRLFQGKVGFSECFVPMNPEVAPLVVKELDMMMLSGTINWFGRLVRTGQEASGSTSG